MPARIVFDLAIGWQADVNGVLHPAHMDPAYAPMVDALWHGGTLIGEADYRWLCAVQDWARDNDPDHPSLHPRRKIDPRLLRPLPPLYPTSPQYEDTTA